MIIQIGHDRAAQPAAAQPVVHFPVGVRQVPDRADVSAPDPAQPGAAAGQRVGW